MEQGAYCLDVEDGIRMTMRSTSGRARRGFLYNVHQRMHSTYLFRGGLAAAAFLTIQQTRQDAVLDVTGEGEEEARLDTSGKSTYLD